MKVELLGDNCRKCQLLKRNVELAIRGCSATIDLQSVCEPQRFADYGLLSLPALAIDGRLKAAGKLLSKRDILSLLTE